MIPLARREQFPIAGNDSVQVLLENDPTIIQFQSAQVSQYGSTQNINQSNSTQPVLTGASPYNAANNADVLVKADEGWVNRKWRPVAGWAYLLICACDFIIFPIAWSLVQAKFGGQVTIMWQPLTLQGAGLFHMAFGALLGITSYGRTKEKLAGVNV